MLSLEQLLMMAGAICVRAMLSIHPHSGESTPPMYGDFEAQRHWQEVTVNLPLKEWYRNTDKNNLTYWGLDYPPLTAYHSFLMGKVAQIVQPESVKLNESHGHESPEHKMWMRLTVLLSDLLVFFPATLAYSRNSTVSMLLLIFYPGLILIDSGHFQYNNVSLGLMVAAVACLLRNRDCLGSVLFVCSFNYKQMELYHAMPFFFYLFGKVMRQETLVKCVWKLTKIAGTVLLTLAAIWAPLAISQDDDRKTTIDAEQIQQILRRIFPLARGLFEDKVANFWCSFNVAVKLREEFTVDQLVLASFAATLTASLPTNLLLLAKPDRNNFLFSLLLTSLAFFLFSFQVHEKSILLVAIPLLMYHGGADDSVGKGRRTSLVCVWFSCITVYSMLPLLIKDRLAVPTFSLSFCYLLLCHRLELFYPKQPFAVATNKHLKPLTDDELEDDLVTWAVDWIVWTLFNLSLVGCLMLGYASMHVKPPSHLPDLWTLLVSLYCFGHFVVFGLYFQYQQIRYCFNCLSAEDNKKKKVE